MVSYDIIAPIKKAFWGFFSLPIAHFHFQLHFPSQISSHVKPARQPDSITLDLVADLFSEEIGVLQSCYSSSAQSAYHKVEHNLSWKQHFLEVQDQNYQSLLGKR